MIIITLCVLGDNVLNNKSQLFWNKDDDSLLYCVYNSHTNIYALDIIASIQLLYLLCWQSGGNALLIQIGAIVYIK
jgi:hypothetical protein